MESELVDDLVFLLKTAKDADASKDVMGRLWHKDVDEVLKRLKHARRNKD